MNMLTKTCFIVVTSFLIVGCNQSVPEAPSEAETAGEGDDHHGHDHASDGPHGGHILGLGDEEYHLEWIHNDSGKLTFYLLDAAVKEDVKTSANSISITTTVKEETKTVTVSTTTPDATEHNKFEIIDPNTKELLGLVGHGVTASASVKIGEQDYTGEFEHQDHGHGHAH
ncbi:MAG: hypothetical protein MK324_15135 [Pirellulales bacterium]|nr:hypothetical protein [Pirellulales bacterium]